MPELDPHRRPVAPDQAGTGTVADPDFWGPEDRTPRRLRHRRPGLADRLGVAGLGRDGRAVLTLAAVIALVAALASFRTPGGAAGPASTTAPSTARSRPTASATTVVVQVAGAVTHPGVVTLPAGARVVDALDATGGALAGADLDHLDLAAKLRDGQQIVVPTTTTSSSTSSTTTTTTDATTTTGPPPPSG